MHNLIRGRAEIGAPQSNVTPLLINMSSHFLPRGTEERKWSGSFPIFSLFSLRPRAGQKSFHIPLEEHELVNSVSLIINTLHPHRTLVSASSYE